MRLSDFDLLNNFLIKKAQNYKELVSLSLRKIQFTFAIAKYSYFCNSN